MIPERVATRSSSERGKVEDFLERDQFPSSIDMFLHDSSHSYRHMLWEFRAFWPRLRDSGLLVSHDVHMNAAFPEFVAKTYADDKKTSRLDAQRTSHYEWGRSGYIGFGLRSRSVSCFALTIHHPMLVHTRPAGVKEIPCGFVICVTFSRKARRDWRSFVRRNKSPSDFLRASNTARPGGLIKPLSLNSRARLMLIALQMLPRLRGVNRIGYRQIIDPLANPVDPTKAEPFIHRFPPCHAQLPRLSCNTRPIILECSQILLQPSAKILC